MRLPRFSVSCVLVAFLPLAVLFAAIRSIYFVKPAYPVPTVKYSGQVALGYLYNRKYVSELLYDTFNSSPTWDRREANPPLSAAKAIEIADKARQQLIKDKILPDGNEYDRWILASARLVPFDEESGIWYWAVKYYLKWDNRMPPNEIDLVVLMDGTYIRPTEFQGEDPPILGTPTKVHNIPRYRIEDADGK